MTASAHDHQIVDLLARGRLRYEPTTGTVIGPRGRPVGGKHQGYLRLDVKDRGGRFSVLLHRVACIAAHGLPDSPGKVVNHKNGNKADNRADNLEWTDHAGNTHHAFATGLRDLPAGGARHYNARLSDEDVAAILRATAAGATPSQLARLFMVSASHVRNIVAGRARRRGARSQRALWLTRLATAISRVAEHREEGATVPQESKS